jgi:serine/threonine-protein kinase
MPILTPEERFGQRVAARYRLQEVLSTGGMGVLFRALDEATGEQVAVKMLKPEYALEPDRVARFVRETRIAGELRHPNLVTVIEVWSDETAVPFLIMELLEGRSLAQELDARRVLSYDEALAIALPIIDALAAAHAVGIIHRDIKPSNIYLCRDGAGELVPKLLDFGIAKCQDDFDTQTGFVLGTPGYMAPEQALLGECSPATDVWGVGAVLYRCLTGHPPHASDSVAELLRKLVRDPVPPLVEVGLSKPARATIDRALARDPHRRYVSMQAFGRALAATSAREGREPMRDEQATELTHVDRIELADASCLPAPERRRGPRNLLLTGAGLLCLLLLAWTLEPMSAVGDRAQSHTAQPAPVVQMRVFAAGEPPLFAADDSQSHVQLPIATTPALPASPVAEQLPRAARRALHRAPLAFALASERSRTRGAAASDVPAARHAITEPEATTGLPVATEW